MTDPSPRPTDEPTPDVDELAEAVIAVPGVHALHAGVLDEVGTYLPGRRVGGVRLRHPGAEVHVVLAPEAPVGETAIEVVDTVRDLAGGPVEVTVEEIARPGAAPDGASGQGDDARP